jgi:hypothetical protein
MIYTPLDSLNKAVQEKDQLRFKSGYILLTTTCNNCHHDTEHAFNVIKTPETPPYSNQDFKKQ